jgi:hypothetical protein
MVEWKPRVLWGFLALITVLIAWRLTVLITHVDPGAESTAGIKFDEGSFRVGIARLNVATFIRLRFQLPRVVVTGTREVMLVITPATRSITIANVGPQGISCAVDRRIFPGGSLALVSGAEKLGPTEPIALTPIGENGSFLQVPSSLRAALAHSGQSLGAIECTLARALASQPTFTDRSLTIDGGGPGAGPFVLDISALEDIDNLRFAGGVEVPFAGERTRLVDSSDSVVSAEWVDVAASERRDIVLVIVGALAAIAAAMAIETIRPFIER